MIGISEGERRNDVEVAKRLRELAEQEMWLSATRIVLTQAAIIIERHTQNCG